ncbi:hypothetical protein [Chrysanthemum yellows phytoplasma]|uniref:hypothetical protein n=1 Tax=Chrysanthemum yellows phytoplasma TaxID=238674 RepID=UPI00068EC810|nr:hypothetical protein [Chrysanthemum yellows phytoplasma]
MFAIHKICIQKTTSDGSTTSGYNSLTNIQTQGIWKPMTLLYWGGAAAQQILANQGKISKEQIFSGIDDDYTNVIEKKLMENNSFDQVDIQELYKQACTIIENNKELWEKIAQELYNKKTLYPNDINRILLNNKELVDKLRS